MGHVPSSSNHSPTSLSGRYHPVNVVTTVEIRCNVSSSPRPQRRDAAINRERVLDAATELVRRDGEKVPMADIARAAGVGIGTVYRHFAAREDLFAALVHRSFELALSNARAAAAAPGSALDGIRMFFTATLRDRERFVLPLHGGPPAFTPQ